MQFRCCRLFAALSACGKSVALIIGHCVPTMQWQIVCVALTLLATAAPMYIFFTIAFVVFALVHCCDFYDAYCFCLPCFAYTFMHTSTHTIANSPHKLLPPQSPTNFLFFRSSIICCCPLVLSYQ